MFATIAHMVMRRVHLTDEDLELTEQACRSLAERYRRDADRHRNPLIRERALESAAKFERIAERMKRFRDAAES
jgi:hypothetical protein